MNSIELDLYQLYHNNFRKLDYGGTIEDFSTEDCADQRLFVNDKEFASSGEACQVIAETVDGVEIENFYGDRYFLSPREYQTSQL